MGTTVYIPDREIIEYVPPWDGSYKRDHTKPLVNRWLQGACFWLLDKLGCRHRREVIQHNVRRERIEYGRVIDAIVSQKDAVHDMLYKDCKAVVLGADKMHELQLSTDNYYAIQLPGSVADLWQFDGKTFAGLTVVFCPWFDGVVTLPSVEVLF